MKPTQALVRHRYHLPPGPYWTGRALRRFGLRATCTEAEARAAFSRLYAPMARQAANGGNFTTMQCRRLIREYRVIRRWIRVRREPAPFVGAMGAFHEWEWSIGDAGHPFREIA